MFADDLKLKRARKRKYFIRTIKDVEMSSTPKKTNKMLIKNFCKNFKISSPDAIAGLLLSDCFEHFVESSH